VTLLRDAGSRRQAGHFAGLLAIPVAAAMVVLAGQTPPLPPLYGEGIARGASGGLISVPAGVEGGYVAGTGFLERPATAAGAAFAVAQEVAADRAWLAGGRVPGVRLGYGRLAERALIDLRLLTLSNGAALAAAAPRFRYVWPRDASFAVAAFSVTGHSADAERVLRFLAAVHPIDGRWQARYLPDGSRGVPDDRGPQLDGSGWVSWAVWCWYVTSPDRPAAAAGLRNLWPMLARSADAAALSLDRRGLPRPSPDYWERREASVTLGTAAPLLTGLRAAADLARRTGRAGEARRWSEAAKRLDTAISRTFRSRGYPRVLPGGGVDAAVTFLAPPFGSVDAAVTQAVSRTADRLRVNNGGLKPGEQWHRDGVAWTPATALFALAFAASAEREQARGWLNWLAEHRTRLGALPERVDPRGRPVSAAPLGWTAALVLLALSALESDLPVPPDHPS
jgi:glucoamylase